MRLFAITVILLTLPACLLAVVQAPQVSATAFYQYDASQPLAVEEKVLEETPTFTRLHVTYASAHDQRVTANLWLPKDGKPKHPAVIVQHGYGDSKEVDYVQVPASILAGKGFVVIAIDAQYHGERKRPGADQALFNVGSLSMRDAFVQTVIDHRRAVDLLQARPEVDPDKIGYWGASMGAFLGSVTCAVEPRIKTVVLVVGGGGLGRRLGHEPTAVEKDTLAVIEPANWIGLISPRPVLMLNGAEDKVVPRQATEILYAAAQEPKRIVWYEGKGHHDVPIDKIMAESVAAFSAM